MGAVMAAACVPVLHCVFVAVATVAAVLTVGQGRQISAPCLSTAPAVGAATVVRLHVVCRGCGDQQIAVDCVHCAAARCRCRCQPSVLYWRVPCG